MAPNPNTWWPSTTRSRAPATGPEPQYQRPSEERILTVDPVVRLPQLDQLRDQLLIPHRAGRRGTGLGGVVAARSHLQLSADELDSEPATIDQVVLVRVDERDYFR